MQNAEAKKASQGEKHRQKIYAIYGKIEGVEEE